MKCSICRARPAKYSSKYGKLCEKCANLRMIPSWELTQILYICDHISLNKKLGHLQKCNTKFKNHKEYLTHKKKHFRKHEIRKL